MRNLSSVFLPSLFFAVALGSVGCGALGYPVGSIYTGTKVPHGMGRVEGSGAGRGGVLKGEACATGILGIAAFGDASLAEAKKKGGIGSVDSVEFRGLSILGIYTQGCTIAHGSAGPGTAGGKGGAGAPPSGDTTDAEGTDWAHHGTGDGLASGEVPKGAADVSGDSKNGSSSGPLTRGKGTATTAPAPTATTPLGVGLPSAPGTSGTPPKVDLVPFSFLFDGKATIPNGADDHTCLSYDPALAPPDRPAVPLTKTGLTPDRGHFVDHCPSENLVATCDQNALLQRKTFFYRGRPEPMFAVDQNVLCAKGSGKWTWLVAPGIPKPPPDPGPFSSACNLPTAQMCIEILPAADQTAQMMWGGWCKRKEATAVAHCPTQGMTGRCDAPQVQNVTIYHYERDTTAARTLCLPGAWSAP